MALKMEAVYAAETDYRAMRAHNSAFLCLLPAAYCGPKREHLEIL
jgi:hypothetical protein